jgi:hypothetical protein
MPRLHSFERDGLVETPSRLHGFPSRAAPIRADQLQPCRSSAARALEKGIDSAQRRPAESAHAGSTRRRIGGASWRRAARARSPRRTSPAASTRRRARPGDRRPPGPRGSPAPHSCAPAPALRVGRERSASRTAARRRSRRIVRIGAQRPRRTACGSPFSRRKSGGHARAPVGLELLRQPSEARLLPAFVAAARRPTARPVLDHEDPPSRPPSVATTERVETRW